MLTFEILKNALTGSVPKSLKRTYDYDQKLVTPEAVSASGSHSTTKPSAVTNLTRSFRVTRTLSPSIRFPVCCHAELLPVCVTSFASGSSDMEHDGNNNRPCDAMACVLENLFPASFVFFF
jgi:hypothetical protein